MEVEKKVPCFVCKDLKGFLECNSFFSPQFFKKKKEFYSFRAVLGLQCCLGFSLLTASGGCSLVAMRWFITAVVSPVAEHRFQGVWASVVAACRLSSCGSWVLEHRLNNCGPWLSCSTACEIFLHQGSNLCLLHWQADSLPPSHQGSSQAQFLFKRLG